MEFAREQIMFMMSWSDKLLYDIARSSGEIIYRFNVAGAAWDDPTPEAFQCRRTIGYALGRSPTR